MVRYTSDFISINVGIRPSQREKHCNRHVDQANQVFYEGLSKEVTWSTENVLLVFPTVSYKHEIGRKGSTDLPNVFIHHGYRNYFVVFDRLLGY